MEGVVLRIIRSTETIENLAFTPLNYTTFIFEGYSGVWKSKPYSPALKFEGNIGPDGSAVFYRKKDFKLISQYTVSK